MINETELSERELEILRLAATGASNKQIAQQLYISANTVKVHMRNIFAKIGVASRTEATLFAIREGIVPASTVLPNGAGMAQEGAEVFEVPGGSLTLPSESVRPRTRLAALLSITVVILLGVLGLSLRNVLFPVVTPEPAPLATPVRWESRAPLPVARSGLAAAVYDGQIYAMAGETEEGVTGEVTRYDPLTDAWEELTTKPVPVTDVKAVVLGEKVYVPGGLLSNGQTTKVLEVYDPRRDIWEQRKSLPVALSAYSLAAYEGRLYLFGGWDGTKAVASVFEYDPAQDAWNERSPMPNRRAYSGAAVSGGKIFIVGGFDGNKALAFNEAYYPQRDLAGEDAWESYAKLPEPRYGMGVIELVDTIYIFGGLSDKTGFSPQLKYLTLNNAWQNLGNTALDNTYSNSALVVVESNLYIIGGASEEQLSTQNVTFQALFTVLLPSLSQ